MPRCLYKLNYYLSVEKLYSRKYLRYKIDGINYKRLLKD